MIDLFIHEAGHLIFSIFGRFIGFLGGSLFQVIIPVATVIVFDRSSLKSAPFTLYWTGQSTINVSIYIGDAPLQRLQLISRGAIHDWRWILNHTGMIEYAGDITGLFICYTGIGNRNLYHHKRLFQFILACLTIQILNLFNCSFFYRYSAKTGKIVLQSVYIK